MASFRHFFNNFFLFPGGVPGNKRIHRTASTLNRRGLTSTNRIGGFSDCSGAVQLDSGVKFSVVVTGDHSTPVMFGDHSHEPVPLAVADVNDVVAGLGQSVVQSFDLAPLPALTQHVQVPEAELQAQAQSQKVKLYGSSVLNKSDHVLVNWEEDVGRNQGSGRSSGDVLEQRAVYAKDHVGGSTPTGGLCSEVQLFDEISAARGQLGRFPSSELMPLIRSILSV
jgi:hypothetical protein